MKWKSNNKYFKWGFTAFWVIAASIMFYYFIFHGTRLKAGLGRIIDILLPIVFGMIISYLLTPVLNYLEYRIIYPFCKKLKIKTRQKLIRMISVFASVFFLLIIVYSLVYMLISEIVPSIVNISSNFNTYVNNFTTWLTKILEDNPDVRDFTLKQIDRYSVELNDWINNILIPKTSELIKTVSISVIGIFKVLWDFIIGLIISIYLLASKEKFTGQAKKMVYALFERPTANIIINNFKYAHKTFGGFISGKVADSIIIGCLCFAGVSILQMPYAPLISVVIGVTNLIPFFGPFLGAIPSAILILLVDFTHPLKCLYFILFILVLQQFDGNILGPKILGDSTGLSSFWVIFSITLFGGLFGVFGMVVGVPLMGVIYGAVKSVLNACLAKKNLPADSDLYTNVCVIENNKLKEYVPEYKLKAKQARDVTFGKEFICTYADHPSNITRKEGINKTTEDDLSDTDIEDDE